MIVPKRLVGYDKGGEEFVHLYEQKFPKMPKPKFMMGVLENVVHEASIKFKPLLVYVHHSEQNKDETANFLRNTIANPEAIKILVAFFLKGTRS